MFFNLKFFISLFDNNNGTTLIYLVSSFNSIYLTSIIQGIPKKNSTTHTPAVNNIFLFFRYLGYSSTKALIIVSKQPN